MTDQHPLTGTAGALQALERTRNENREAMERLAHPLTDEMTECIDHMKTLRIYD